MASYLNIGSDPGGFFYADAIIDDVSIWKIPLTAAQIKAVNNRKRALAVERNYFSALELLIPNFEPEIVRGTEFYTYVLEPLEKI